MRREQELQMKKKCRPSGTGPSKKKRKGKRPDCNGKQFTNKTKPGGEIEWGRK